jgi:phosphotransferase system enzyme I (PtsP)
MSRNLRNHKDHAQLICDIGELSGLFTDSTSLETFLQKIVQMIACHMRSDVCSIYLYYEDARELVLKATHGLNEEFIGNVRLRIGEGLTGLSLKEMRPICERHASRNARFRYFPGLGEEKYESFLSVPILRGRTMIGALVVQNTEKNCFTESDIQALRAISSQLANTIEMTRLILSIEERSGRQETPPALELKALSFVKGKVGAPGYALGDSITVQDKAHQLVFCGDARRQYTIDDFYRAVLLTEQQLEKLQQQIEEKLSDVASLIFTAQILMLKDQALIEAVVSRIQEGAPPPEAIITVIDRYIRKFESIPNVYLREKSFDVRDIGRRLLENLCGSTKENLDYQGRIVIARELLPSDALKLSSQRVKGIILLHGGATSHLSILARSLEIPLIIADMPELLQVPDGTRIIMDAGQGNIYVQPSPEVLARFSQNEETRHKLADLQKEVKPETWTKDKHRVRLMANINLLGDLQSARDCKAEGIGLYRTEFPFIVRNDFPSEEEQYVIYQKLVDSMAGKEITFRTLDIGGDKVLSYYEHHQQEKNPYMGMRSIRFSLRHGEIFSQQIRAILRSGAGAELRIMFPMISSLDEFRAARKIVLDDILQLKKEGAVCHTEPKIGLMIELPAVLEIIDELAAEADFFSIGTNDFIQYMLAVDRTNEKVANLYISHHPSVLRALKKIVDAAGRAGIDVSVCGDMAHKEDFLAYLVGIGLRKFSVDASYIPRIQSLLAEIDTGEARVLAAAVLKQTRLADIGKLLRLKDAGV